MRARVFAWLPLTGMDGTQEPEDREPGFSVLAFPACMGLFAFRYSAPLVGYVLQT